MTLPAMSEDDLSELWHKSDPHGPGANERFSRAIIAARDAQWQVVVEAAVAQDRERWRAACEAISQDLRNHDMVRLGAAKCLDRALTDRDLALRIGVAL